MRLQTESLDAATNAGQRETYRFLLLRAHDPRVLPIRQYIRDQFARHYGARIRDFMPLQMAMVRRNEIKAAAGLRCAGDEPLFVEQYLDEPCESGLGEFYGLRAPPRSRIAEVGNLAATEAGAARELFFHIAAVARSEGLQWLMCNATRRVQVIFNSMKLPFSPMRVADRSRVADPASWGSYYDRPSCVMAAPVSGIVNAMLDMDLFRFTAAESRARSNPATDIRAIHPGQHAIGGPVPLSRERAEHCNPGTNGIGEHQ